MAAGGEVQRLCGAQRILVVGPSGAGKTQLALRLGELLGLPVVHLDAHRWQAGWVSLPDHAWRPVVAELTHAPTWIMDGMYESTLDLRVPAADAVVVLELQRIRCVLGAFRRRVLGRRRPRPDAPPGQRIDRAFVRYIWRYPTATRPLLLAQLRTHGGGKTVVFVRGRREARRLVDDVRRTNTAPTSP